MHSIKSHPIIAVCIIILFHSFSLMRVHADTNCDAGCAEEALLYAGISDAVYNNTDYIYNGTRWVFQQRLFWGDGCQGINSQSGWCTHSGFDAGGCANLKMTRKEVLC